MMPTDPSDEPIDEAPQKPAKKYQHWLPPHEWKAANEIADLLNETEKQSRRQIVFVIKDMGLEFAQAILQETLAIEAQGGMMLPDGSRRRTPGGVFFKLVRNRVPPKIRYQIFRPQNATAPSPSHPASSFAWADRRQIVAPLLEAAGIAATAKAVLVGSPEQINDQAEYVVFQLTETTSVKAFPKAVPRPELPPSTCTVYVAIKQWKWVEEAAADPEDDLIIEGVCAYNPESAGIALYATSITSKRLQAKKRKQKVNR